MKSSLGGAFSQPRHYTLYSMASSSSKGATRKRNVSTAKPRTPGGAIGGLLGALVMSVVAGILVTVAVTPVVAVSGIAASSAISIFENLPNHLNPGRLAQPSVILAKNSKGDNVELATFYAQDREMVGWDDISQFVKDAAVSTEDPRFFTHGGVDIISLGRATLGQVLGSSSAGASTITMQYVRNVLVQQAESILDEEEREAAYEDATRQDFDRKLQEISYAIGIEKKFSKDEILLGYLNIANFGGQVYGIESAAQTYYGKASKDLTLSEAASLIAIVQYPSILNLRDEENIEANQERRDYVLGRMLDANRITQAQYEEAVATDVVPKLTVRKTGCAVAESNYGLGHFCDMVQRSIELDPSFGNTAEERHFNFLRGGYQIMTTIDLDLQKAAVRGIRDVIPQTMSGINIGAAVTSVQVGTGRILTMAQNRPFSADPDVLAANPGYTSINYNTDYDYGGSSGFQVGSTAKVWTLAEWLRSGHSLMDSVNGNGRQVNDSSFRASCLGGVYGNSNWRFKNDAGERPGNTTVMNGTAQSINGVFVSMQQQMDLCDTISLAEALGVHRAYEMTNPDFPNYGTTKLTINPAAAFAGTDEIAPLTMATAYATFANKGVMCTAVPIDWITDSDGNEVSFTKSKCTEAVSPDVAAGVLYALQGVVQNGTMRHSISSYGVPHFGKSGTTDDAVDRWNAGGSSKVVTVVWNGNVVGKVSLNNTGLGRPERHIYTSVMDAADRKYGGNAFPDPPRSATVRVMVPVPDVSGRSFSDAEALLKAAGFGVAKGPNVDSPVPQGLVASTNPAGEASRGSTITVNISKGNMQAIPNVVGSTYAVALGTLSGAGFNNVSSPVCAADPAPVPGFDPLTGKVVAMSPAGGSAAIPSYQVTLTVKCAPDTP